ncbi:hypothetical protein [Bacillus sp. FJAT-26390]|uniref:hypothetical protein n=1 Tax=Bacillus sp. FJAT-26390 TaxID=1743142 RepID=UPI000807F330|nr:hypothetical protein [Bacillus sp. FJAT-26390]OBZ16627.1 hypothetical protein A7975_01545 [Bacillus sp. FJAT-26390]
MNKRLAAALLTLALLAGCGNPSKQQEEAGSFAMNSAASTPAAGNDEAVATEAASLESSEKEVAVVANEATNTPSETVVPDKTKAAALPDEGKNIAASVPAEKKTPAATKPPVQQEKKQSVPAKAADKTPAKPPAKTPVSESKEPLKEATDDAKNVPAAGKKNNGSAEISWSKFFDNEDQTTPSDQFWDLSGSNVEINGYMGEVLSFENNWFLLIPKPGAECPFDNGDETYWNKIMIVFVPEGTKLRHHTGPLKISGRLDVGIKIDESGYKTMFRLYDASFEEIKE